jgi:hypothetical protein
MEGLTYVEGFVSPSEERAVLDAIEPLEFRAVTIRGQTARARCRPPPLSRRGAAS